MVLPWLVRNFNIAGYSCIVCYLSLCHYKWIQLKHGCHMIKNHLSHFHGYNHVICDVLCCELQVYWSLVCEYSTMVAAESIIFVTISLCLFS